MKKRPIAVTVVGWLTMAAGGFGLARGFIGAKTLWPPEHDLIWILIVDVLGIACGLFMLRSKNWARWLTVAWVGGHAAAMSIYEPREALVHVVIFALIAYLLIFRPDVREYFRSR